MRPPGTADRAADTLARIIELTRQEREHIIAADAGELARIHALRAELLDALPEPLPAACHGLVAEYAALSSANVVDARVQSRALRIELQRVGKRHTAVSAYAPSANSGNTHNIAIDREG